jgi:hypothetical protein
MRFGRRLELAAPGAISVDNLGIHSTTISIALSQIACRLMQATKLHAIASPGNGQCEIPSHHTSYVSDLDRARACRSIPELYLSL